MVEAEKADLIKNVIEILNKDFGSKTCGKHSDIHLSCVSCQAAIVVSWLEDIVDLVYSGEEL